MVSSLKRFKIRIRTQQKHEEVKLTTGCGWIGINNQSLGLHSSASNSLGLFKPIHRKCNLSVKILFWP